MNQVRVKDLYKNLEKLIGLGYGDRAIVVPDDNECNAFHGLYFGCTYEKKDIEDCIESSNGIYDSEVTDLDKIVILG